MITRNNDFSYEDAEIWLNGIHYPRASLQIKDGFPVDPPFPLAVAAVNMKNVAHLFVWAVSYKSDSHGHITLVNPDYLENVFVVPRFELTEEAEKYRVWRSQARVSLIEAATESKCTDSKPYQRFEFSDLNTMQMARYDGNGLVKCGGFVRADDISYLSILY